MKVLLYKSKGLIPAAIRFVTWGEYSHAALLTPQGTIIEAWHFGGVREIPASEIGERCEVFEIIGATRNQLWHMEQYARLQVGKPYDYLGIARYLLRLPSHNDAWFCSELVAEAAEVAGIPLLRREPHQVSPSCLGASVRLRRV